MDTEGSNEPIVQHMTEVTSPHVAMMARLSHEPELAEHADLRDSTEARRLADNMRLATNRARDKRLDLRLLESIAVAPGNPLLAELHRIMNAVRNSVVRSRREVPQDGLAPDFHSFVEHDCWADHATMREHPKIHATFLKED